MRRVALLALGLALGCRGGTKHRSAPPIDAAPEVETEADAAPAAVDEPDEGDDAGAAPRVTGRGGRDRRTVQLLLRSTPPNAVATVDGVALGATPVLWEGELGQLHDFRFDLPAYQQARYRFVPVTGGIVHATLVKDRGEALLRGWPMFAPTRSGAASPPASPIDAAQPSLPALPSDAATVAAPDAAQPSPSPSP